MAKKEQTVVTSKKIRKPLVRDHVVAISLNDAEYKTLEKYCTKYHITNRSGLIRELMMKSILIRMSEDYPTLFGEKEMR
jgi:hypothetical protein